MLDLPYNNLLDNAYKEAIDYVKGLSNSERPRYIMISDFDVFELYTGEVFDREKGLIKRFSLPDLPTTSNELFTRNTAHTR